MNPAPLPDLKSALAAYRHLMRADRFNVEALCEVGLALRHARRPDESKRCFQATVEVLHRAAAAGDVDYAAYLEGLIYETFVKTFEDEQHYSRCFGSWQRELAALGQRYRNTNDLADKGATRFGFVLPAGTLLGHTEVLFKLLEHRHAGPAQALSPKIYVLFQHGRAFLERAAAVGVEVCLAEQELPAGTDATVLQRIVWLRERLRKDLCSTAIWVSSPVHATLVLSMRVAPVQIFWALRFHPITGPYIDGYITYGPRTQRDKVIGRQTWRVCPVPLTIDVIRPEAAAMAALRARFPERLLIGTLARTDKIDSKPFLAAVTAILKANPDAGYLWTGKERHPGIERFFQSQGVADRCHFVGWVDTVLYAHVLDLFLETFPLGCGITGYQALGAGTPLLSYLEENTVFGMQFGQDFASTRARTPDLSEYPITCATSPQDYVALANRLLADPAYREGAGERGRQFFQTELASAANDAARFFGTIAEITTTTLAAGLQ